jgi:hypothetical protein
MQKINHTKLNRSNNDIWGLLVKAVDSGNIALVKVNLDRLYELQKYYLRLLEFQDSEIASLKDFLASTQQTLNEFEKDWITRISKDNNVYEETRKRINDTFQP